jgi:hypothetical protein
MRPLPRAVHVVTAALLMNMLVATVPSPQWLLVMLFAATPVLMIWLAVSVLRDGSVPMRDLPEGHEWGYQDRNELRPQ